MKDSNCTCFKVQHFFKEQEQEIFCKQNEPTEIASSQDMKCVNIKTVSGTVINQVTHWTTSKINSCRQEDTRNHAAYTVHWPCLPQIDAQRLSEREVIGYVSVALWHIGCPTIAFGSATADVFNAKAYQREPPHGTCEANRESDRRGI